MDKKLEVLISPSKEGGGVEMKTSLAGNETIKTFTSLEELEKKISGDRSVYGFINSWGDTASSLWINNSAVMGSIIISNFLPSEARLPVIGGTILLNIGVWSVGFMAKRMTNIPYRTAETQYQQYLLHEYFQENPQYAPIPPKTIPPSITLI